jgi:uncharacterized protein (TIGR02246 family)
MDPVLARLEAESAIRRLVGLYCDAVNRRDADAAGQLFAPDCRITIAGGRERVGRDLQIEGMRQTFAAFAFLHQQCDASLIEVTGETASARLSVFEASQKHGEARISLIFGAYEDAYVRLAQAWRFQSRRYVLHYRCLADVTKAQLAAPVGLV